MDEKSITGGKFELVCRITNILSFILYESKAQEGQLCVWCKIVVEIMLLFLCNKCVLREQ
jgi:hypothetical protein